jgi:hypothetical protein
MWITLSCGSDSVLKTSPINMSLSETVQIFRPYFAAIRFHNYTVSSKCFKMVYVTSNHNSVKVASMLGFGSREWMIPSLARMLTTLINHPNYSHYSCFLPNSHGAMNFHRLRIFSPASGVDQLVAYVLFPLALNAA